MKSFTKKIVRIITLGGVLLALSTGFITSLASASTELFPPREASISLPQVLTPTLTSTLQLSETINDNFSLADLGYEEKILISPYDKVQYSFSLPENRVVQGDAMLYLDLSYTYLQADIGDERSTFGNLTITLDDQPIESLLPIEQAALDHYQLRIPIPADLLNKPGRTYHTLEIILNAGFLCRVWHEAQLIIHPTSNISLSYQVRPPNTDLANYPRPFYQQTIEAEYILLTLPESPSMSDLNNATGVAAKLGDLTYDLTISATTGADLSRLAATTPKALDESIIVIGQPQDNQAIPMLNNLTKLPVSLHQRKLPFISVGPTAVSPNVPFSYTFSVTNADSPTRLSFIDTFPLGVEVVSCTPDCTIDTTRRVLTWTSRLLEPDEEFSATLTLKTTAVITKPLENIITLADAETGPLNGSLLTATVTAKPEQPPQPAETAADGYFFVYQGQAVAQTDGIIQEIISPWNKSQVILIITGLNDNAVRKAAQAMSSETRLPGMSGAVAFVQEGLSLAEIANQPPPAVERTFEDLGYSDQLIQGAQTAKQIDYYFDLPYGWQLTDDAFVDLYFIHAQSIDFANSNLTLLLNKQPLANIALTAETADNGHLHVPLGSAQIEMGQKARLTVRIHLSMIDPCANYEHAWLLIKNSSKVFLPHDEATNLYPDFRVYPNPFHLDSTLSNLLFTLPASPSTAEWGETIKLASVLGNAAKGKTIWPTVVTGDQSPPLDWGNYHIIALGRPSRNPVIQEINTHLPQSFLPATDEINQQLDTVKFRLPPGLNLGYLQLLPSLWDKTQAILAVTGTTDQGIRWATDVLVNRPWALGNGDLALIKEKTTVNTIDTRKLTRSGTALAIATVTAPQVITETAAAPSPAPPPTPAPASEAAPLPSPVPTIPEADQAGISPKTPDWLIPLVIATVLIIFVIFIIAFRHSRQQPSMKL